MLFEQARAFIAFLSLLTIVQVGWLVGLKFNPNNQPKSCVSERLFSCAFFKLKQIFKI